MSKIMWACLGAALSAPFGALAQVADAEPTERLRLSLRGTNLFDEVVARQISVASQGAFALNDTPRQYGIALQARF
ncbi:MAG: hypothetical protein Q8Q88_11245 [Phenylobacterium sp.]|uniref:hypothetical protein n=1 Tax=Phenylobacterium sp. TaxID=1871053 RepID=UPI0027359ECC|nr:hypothetical protein [Phenylobacterium sp.]MDP3747608.1 hypothetical protein [Phenylobacterium sp.]